MVARWAVAVVLLAVCGAAGLWFVFAGKESTVELRTEPSSEAKPAALPDQTPKAPLDAAQLKEGAAAIAADQGRESAAYVACLKGLAAAYAAQSQPKDARQALQEAVMLAEVVHGTDSVELADLLKDLARNVEDDGQRDAAATLYQRAIDAYEKSGSQQQSGYIAVLRDLAHLHYLNRDPKQSRPLLVRALQAAKEHHGEDSLEYASVAKDYGQTAAALGETKLAAELLSHATESYALLRGKTSKEYVLGRIQLGFLYNTTGEVDSAKACWLEVVELAPQVYGEGSLHHQIGLRQLSTTYQAAQAFDLAASPLLEVLRLRGERPQPEIDDAEILESLGAIYMQLGIAPQAKARFLEAAEAWKQVAGPQDFAVGRTMSLAGHAALAAEELPQAIELLTRGHALLKQIKGPAAVETCFALRDLGLAATQMGDYATAKACWLEILSVDPHDTNVMGSLVALHSVMNEFAEAEVVHRTLMERVRGTEGEASLAYARASAELGSIYAATSRLAAAREAFAKAATIYAQSRDTDPRAYASAMISLSGMHLRMGNYAQCESILHEVRGVLEKAGIDRSAEYASCLSALAGFHQEIHDLARAAELRRQAAEIGREVYGTRDIRYFNLLESLAVVHQSAANYQEAAAVLRETLELEQVALGEKHPTYLNTRRFLGLMLASLEQFDEAERTLRQVLEVQEAAFGPDAPVLAATLQDLGSLHQAMRKPKEAERDYLRAAGVFQKAHLESLYVLCLSMAGTTSFGAGNFDQAASYYQQALDAERARVGTTHQSYASLLTHLANAQLARRQPRQAETLIAQALEIRRRTLDDAFGVLAERQQLLMTQALREDLDSYLSLPDVAVPRVYDAVVAWKGAAFARQRYVRSLRSQPELLPIFAELQATTARLTAYSLGESQDRRPASELEELLRRKERLEADLARGSAQFDRERSIVKRVAADVQAALPENVALVDYLQYTRFVPWQDGQLVWRREQRLAAFVMRHGRPIERVELGSVADIEEALGRWQPNSPAGAKDASGKQLRALVWAPCEKLLDDDSTVLVSPDGVTARIPFVALPGRTKPFLLEERRLALIAVPRLLPELLASSPSIDAPRRASDMPPLFVGDLDYDAGVGASTDGLGEDRPADPGPPAASVADFDQHRSVLRGSSQQQFAELAGAKAEIQALSAIWARSHAGVTPLVLDREACTEAALRGAVRGRSYLHLATHGFFAPESLLSVTATPSAENPADALATQSLKPFAGEAHATVGLDPGILSGIALSGANRPSGACLGATDDGILSAVEVAQLDLDGSDLVVLSACETGLGKVAGGEGVLGLQRAFQIAGARAVVASLWTVPDRGTQLLMERFYENLWDKKLDRLEALRQAQLWMLRSGAEHPDMVRGLTVATVKPPADGSLPPFYWAGFFLSGDWR